MKKAFLFATVYPAKFLWIIDVGEVIDKNKCRYSVAMLRSTGVKQTWIEFRR